MPPRQRIAVTIPAGQSVSDTIKRVKWAEANGYEDGWMSDTGSPDSLTLMAGLAAHAPTLRLGIAIVPVYSRTPAVLAATANTLGQLMPGRVVLGLGASSQTMMDQWNGVPLRKPLTRVRETAIMIRSMLAGENRTSISPLSIPRAIPNQPWSTRCRFTWPPCAPR